MKSGYLIIFIILFPLACSQHFKRETIKSFVFFSHSGFQIKDSIKYVVDSNNLDIRQYLEYKPDSMIKISLRRNNHIREFYIQNPTFFKGLNDTLTNILENPYFQNTILPKKDSLSMYSGLYYTLYFETSDERKILINYIPDTLPNNLMRFHNYILGMIYKPGMIQKEFKFDTVVRVQAMVYYKFVPPPPPPSIN